TSSHVRVSTASRYPASLAHPALGSRLCSADMRLHRRDFPRLPFAHDPHIPHPIGILTRGHEPVRHFAVRDVVGGVGAGREDREGAGGGGGEELVDGGAAGTGGGEGGRLVVDFVHLAQVFG